MNFKTKEELLHKVTDDGYIGGIEDAFNSFAERIKLYNKYKNDMFQFEKDFPDSDLTKEWLNQSESWNDYLFKHCFKDVIE